MSRNKEFQDQSIEENEEVEVYDETEYDEEYADEYDEEYYEKSKFSKIISLIFKIIVCLVAFAVAFTIGAEVIAATEYPKILVKPREFMKTEQAQKVLREPLSEKAYVDWMNSKGEKVSIKNSEGYVLNGVFIKKYDTTNTYVIIFHPYTAGMSDMAKYARFFHDMDCNVLVAESRGYGESKYETNTFGYLERYDVQDWAKEIAGKDKDSAIFLFGLGAGGSTVLMASSLDMPENVKGIIADSAYPNLYGLFKDNTTELYNLPSFPTVAFASRNIEKNFGFNPKDVDVIEQVENSKLPVLLIQSGDDELVDEDDTEALYEACTVEGSDHLYIGNASHCGGLDSKPKKYGDNISYFILENIDN